MVTNIGLSAVATGTADVITATYSPAITLSDRRIVFLTGCVANLTTTPTFNPNALGAQVIKGKGGVALKAGEILGDCILIYHTTGTYWELIASQLTRSTWLQILANGQVGDEDYAIIGNSLTWNGNDLADQPFAQSVADTAEDNAKAYADANKQPIDSDLTSIAGLTPSNDDIIQRKAGSWVNRTLAQLWTDLKDLTVTLTNKTLAVGSNSITGTASRVAQFGAGGSLEASSTTDTQLSYLDATSSIQTQLNSKKGVIISFFPSAQFSPSDGAKYYFGSFPASTVQSTVGFGDSIAPVAFTIKSVYGISYQVAGSNENVTYEIGVNGSYTTISTTVQLTATSVEISVTGLNISVSAGDNITIRMVCPTWVTTNPANMRAGFNIYGE